jgi:Beta/Gamma crystallin
MKKILALALTCGLTVAVPMAAIAAGKVKTSKGMLTLYAGQKFTGDYFEVTKDRTSMSTEFSIGSIAVFEGDKWEVCEGQRFKAPCMTLTSNTEDLGEITIRSARKVADAAAN